MIKAIATDLDGTLFYPKKRIFMITNKNKKFIKEFVSKGNKIIIVTGRNSHTYNRLSRKLGCDISLVGCNGALVIDNKKIILEKFLDKAKVKDIYESLNKEENSKIMCWMVFTSKGRLYIEVKNKNPFIKLLFRIVMLLEGAYRDKYRYGKRRLEYLFSSKCEEKIYKIMPCYGWTKKHKENARLDWLKLSNRYEEKLSITWSDAAVEIVSANTSKSKSLKELINYYNLKDDEVAVIGDSGNDISLFEEFYENSYVMFHARKEIKAKAKHVVNSVNDIRKYLEREE